MECELVRGDCPICGQQRVLGFDLNEGQSDQINFRCCGCVDEHGRGELYPRANVTTGVPSNWWASLPPPEYLEDDDCGCLERTHYQFCCQSDPEKFTAVTDPAHHYFSGHGAERVWPAALVLANHLSDNYAGQPEWSKVVELGAGTGLPSFVMSRSGCPSATVTDVPWLVPLMEFNIQANFESDDCCRPSAMPLRWGSDVDAKKVMHHIGGAPDIVIAADIIYRREDFDALISTLTTLGARKVVMAVTERGGVVADFMHRLELEGWDLEANMVFMGAEQAVILEVTPTWTPIDGMPNAEEVFVSPKRRMGRSPNNSESEGRRQRPRLTRSVPCQWPRQTAAQAAVAAGCRPSTGSMETLGFGAMTMMITNAAAAVNAA